jgi:hypothetical protein
MSDKVAMKALDTLHISNVHADNLVEGDVFLVSEDDAARLEKAGLAERGGKASDAVNSAEALASRPDTREALEKERGGSKALIGGAPANKAEAAAPENKSAKKGKK